MLLPGGHEKNVTLGKRNPRVVEDERSATQENDIEFILFMRVLVVRSLRGEEDNGHGSVFDCFNIPHTLWPPIGSG